MAAPCFENQAKDKLKLPKDVMYAFTDRLLEHLKAGHSYSEALDVMHQETGLQPETINSMYRRDPKSLSITKQAIARAGAVRQLRNAADALAGDLKTNGSIYQEPGRIAKAWDIQRKIALSGHSPVFPWTHMRNWAVQIPTEAGRERMGAFWRAAGDVWRYYGEKGQALHEMDMTLMQKGDRYDFFRQSGADITPGKLGPGDILLQGRKPSWQTRNFDALRVGRYTALDAAWSHLDPALKEGDTGKAMGAMLARDMNYATGSIMPPAGESANMLAKTGAQLSQLAGHYNLLLSSKLFFAKHMDAWLSPLRYLAKSGRMTTAERASANIALGRWANTVAAHLGILGVNYAFNKAMGWQTPNLTDPSKSDFWRLRIGNAIVPFSPMLEALRLPIVFTTSLAAKGSDEAGTKLWRAVWNAAHPAFHTAYEQIAGKDFRGRPVPSIRGLISPVKSKLPPVSPGEYFGTRFTPIAISGGVAEFYQALRHENVPPSLATAFLKSAGSAAASALVGTHLYEEEPKASKGISQKPMPGMPKTRSSGGVKMPKL